MTDGIRTTPVPYTGRSRGGHYFRRMRIASVKRALLAVYDRLRGLKLPREPWDDYPIAANRDRTWKRHRQTQWKEMRRE